MAGYGRDFRVYSTNSLTRYCGRPTWVDLTSSNIGPCGTEALGSEDRFFGRLATWTLGSLQFVLTNARGVSVRAVPGPALDLRLRAPNVWLGMCLAGSYEIAWGRRAVEVKPAHIAVLDFARARTLTFSTSSDLLWVKVPHGFLTAQLPEEDLTVIDGTRGSGYLAQHILRGIMNQAHEPDLGDTEDTTEDAAVDGVMKLVSAAAARSRVMRRALHPPLINQGDPRPAQETC